MISFKSIRADVSQEMSYVYEKVKQYDNLSRKYRIMITDKGNMVSLKGNEAIRIRMWADGESAPYVDDWLDEPWENGYPILIMTSRMLSKVGRVKYEFVIQEPGSPAVISTRQQNLLIQKSLIDYDGIIASEDFDVLSHLIGQATTIPDLINDINVSLDDVSNKISEVNSTMAEYERQMQTYATEYGEMKTDMQDVIDALHVYMENVENSAASSAKLSESWAIGGTNSRDGEATNNSKFHSDQSKLHSDTAKESADRAEEFAGHVDPKTLSQINAIDSNGLLGTEGATVVSQNLVDEFATNIKEIHSSVLIIDTQVAVNTLQISDLQKNKADKNEVNALTTEKATKAEVEVERQRINNFTALATGSTTGDAELTDARIGADGVTYSNVGGAIRSQINTLKNDKIDKKLSIILYQNGIDSTTGQIVTRSDRLYSDVVQVSDVVRVEYEDTFEIGFAKYDNNGAFLGSVNWFPVRYNTTITKMINDPNCTHFKLVVRKTTNASIAPSDVAYFYAWYSVNILDAINNKIKAHGDIINGKASMADLDYNAKMLSMLPVSIGSLNMIARLGYDVYNVAQPPEQSIESYKLAVKNGYKILLADLQRTLDGEFVCLHDTTINSVARNADGTTIATIINIKDITLAQADTYDFGIYRGSKYSGTKILRLNDFLLFCKKTNCMPVIETKILCTEAECNNIADMVIKYGLSDNFMWAELAEFKRTIPWLITKLPKMRIMMRGGSYLYTDTLAAAQEFAALGYTVDLNFTTLEGITSEAIAACNSSEISMSYSEVKTDEEAISLLANVLINNLKYVVSRKTNIYKLMYETIF